MRSMGATDLQFRTSCAPLSSFASPSGPRRHRWAGRTGRGRPRTTPGGAEAGSPTRKTPARCCAWSKVPACVLCRESQTVYRKHLEFDMADPLNYVRMCGCCQRAAVPVVPRSWRCCTRPAQVLASSYHAAPAAWGRRTVAHSAHVGSPRYMNEAPHVTASHHAWHPRVG